MYSPIRKRMIANETIARIPFTSPFLGNDYHKALAKRFPKAFKIKNNDLHWNSATLSDRECDILIKACNNRENVTGNKFFSVTKFWDDLVEDRRIIAERAVVVIAKRLKCSYSDIHDVINMNEQDMVVVAMKSGRSPDKRVSFLDDIEITLSMKSLRKSLRKDHYRAIVNGWVRHYGPLFNWL